MKQKIRIFESLSRVVLYSRPTNKMTNLSKIMHNTQKYDTRMGIPRSTYKYIFNNTQEETDLKKKENNYRCFLCWHSFSVVGQSFKTRINQSNVWLSND
jgi:hypothetical protein